jgi:LuxR family maltose regulon positive regulatory protein
VLGVVLYERNELEEAAKSAQLAVEWSDLGGNPEARVIGYLCLAKTRLAQGNLSEATALMEKCDQAANHQAVPPFFRAWHAASRALFALWKGNLAEAMNWSGRVSEQAQALPFAFHHVPARLLIARGENTAAAEQLKDLYETAVLGDAQGLMIAIRVYQTLAAATTDEALSYLGEALTLGQPEGFIRTFVDEGRLLAPLLRRAVSHGIAPEYARRLLNIIEDEEHRRRIQSNGVAHRPSSLLSERELEIAGLIAAGLSNRQIAERLIISPGTAKTHVHNIFEKLNAKDRLQAVTRARDLKLI